MRPTAAPTVYDQVVTVAHEYLGPAAERFVERSIEAHLGKQPKELTKEDIPQLHEWSKLAIALLTEDTELVNKFSRDLLSIADTQQD